MTVWNLTEFSELEERVLTPYEIPQVKRSNRRIVSKAQGLVAVVAAATSMTIAMAISGIELNSGTFSSPVSSIAFAQSGTEQKPPLEDLFAGRFDGEWSAELEYTLLATVESNRKEPSRAELLEQTIDSIFYNQQEDVSEEAERLSREEVERIVKQRK